MKNKRKAFTLTELLVVVIVLGILAAVAVPKFTRVLETRRTTEAEDLLSAVRTEQEHRCLAGKNYTARPSLLPMTAKADSKYYGLSLEDKGAVAARGDNKNYELRILYNSGKLCCSGEGCAALNKDYEPCDANWGNLSDECAATDGGEPVPPPADPCVTNPNDCECSTYASAHQCECAPSTSTCCEEGETWNEQTQECDKVCLEKTEYIGSSSASETDTCDGNTSAKYTCDGVFNGTCIDVYEGSGFQAGLASWTVDPFWNFDGALAQTSMSDGPCPIYLISCPKLVPGQKQWCCPQGTRCKSIGLGEYDCVKGDPMEIPEIMCADGYIKDPNGDCVPELPSAEAAGCEFGYVWDEAAQKCVKEPAQECGAGCTWDASLKTCVCGGISVHLFSKRSVTCCGTGATPSVPHVQKCEDCSCAAYAQAHQCECAPSAATCCAKCETYSGGVCKKMECASGQILNTATCKCEKKCTNSYGEWKTVSSFAMDTCNGNKTDAYTCGTLKKNCADVRTTHISGGDNSRPCNPGECLSYGSNGKCLIVCGGPDTSAPLLPDGSPTGPGHFQDTIIGGGSVGGSSPAYDLVEQRDVVCCGLGNIADDIVVIPIGNK